MIVGNDHVALHCEQRGFQCFNWFSLVEPQRVTQTSCLKIMRGSSFSPPPPPSMSCQSAGWLEGRWYPSSSKNLAISCLQCQLIEPCFWHSITFQPRSFSPMAEVWKHTSLNTNPPKPPPRWVGQAPSGPRAICNFSWQSVPKTYPSHPRGYRHPSLNRPMAGLHAGANLQDKASPTLSLAKLA